MYKKNPMRFCLLNTSSVLGNNDYVSSLTTDKRLLVFVIVQYLRELIINQIGLMFKRENACFSEDFRDLMSDNTSQ